MKNNQTVAINNEPHRSDNAAQAQRSAQGIEAWEKESKQHAARGMRQNNTSKQARARTGGGRFRDPLDGDLDCERACCADPAAMAIFTARDVRCAAEPVNQNTAAAVNRRSNGCGNRSRAKPIRGTRRQQAEQKSNQGRLTGRVGCGARAELRRANDTRQVPCAETHPAKRSNQHKRCADPKAEQSQHSKSRAALLTVLGLADGVCQLHIEPRRLRAVTTRQRIERLGDKRKPQSNNRGNTSVSMHNADRLLVRGPVAKLRVAVGANRARPTITRQRNLKPANKSQFNEQNRSRE